MKAVILLAATLSYNVNANEQLVFTQHSQAAIKEFSTMLKSELVTAMKAGGPISAITVCNQSAPIIASQLSEKYNMEIGRTSLKVRNADNQADQWETKVLTQFEQQKEEGNPIAELVFSEAISDGSNGSEMRMLKAIPTGQVCLSCHGNNIADKVQAKIDELYPHDQATGFKLGDIRGAFTVLQKP